mgnify:FL=1
MCGRDAPYPLAAVQGVAGDERWGIREERYYKMFLLKEFLRADRHIIYASLTCEIT